MKETGTRVPGWIIDKKTGKVIRNEKRYDVSTQLKRKRSSRVRVGKKHIGQGRLI